MAPERSLVYTAEGAERHDHEASIPWKFAFLDPRPSSARQRRRDRFADAGCARRSGGRHALHGPAPGEMQRLVEAGYRMIRTDLQWGSVERQPGRYDFAAYDRLMVHLKQAKVRPMFILDYGNRLYDHGQSPRSDPARAAFARFGAAAARHFRGQGVVWEIWNEPNIEQFWKPKARCTSLCPAGDRDGPRRSRSRSRRRDPGPGLVRAPLDVSRYHLRRGPARAYRCRLGAPLSRIGLPKRPAPIMDGCEP